MALIVMSSVVISSVGLSSLILSSLQQTRVIDSASVAYYAAESGAEEALFRARRTGNLPTSVGTPQALTNNATWKRAVADREPVVYAGYIPQDSFAEVALYDPDAPTVSQNIDHVDVSWTDTCLGCTVLSATMVGWVAGGPIVWDPNAATYTFTGGAATLSTGGANKLYRLRLSARRGAMENVQIRAYDGSGQPVDLPGRVKIDAEGSFGGVTQKLTVTLPRRAPLGGVFDFVVFSECSLVKSGAISCP